MSKLAWLSVDSLPATTKTIAFTVPNDESWLALLRGALIPLTYSENYEQFETLTPNEMADYWRPLILNFFEEIPMFPTGTIIMFSTIGGPGDGWLLCDGSLVLITDYPDLYNTIGYLYGQPGNQTHFYLPDLSSRFPVGYDQGATAYNVPGKVGGQESVTLTSNQMPAHSHVQNSHNHGQNSHNHGQDAHDHPSFGGLTGSTGTAQRALRQTTGASDVTTGNATATNQAATATNQAATATNQNTGGGASHENRPPFITLTFFIKT